MVTVVIIIGVGLVGQGHLVEGALSASHGIAIGTEGERIHVSRSLAMQDVKQ